MSLSQERPAQGLVVAIDGPSGSGKSTIGRHLASSFGLAYLDTGAMYRAVAWYARERGLALADTSPAVVASVDQAAAELARALPLVEPLDPEEQVFVVDGTDVTAAIRTSEISTVVSRIATNLAVRAALRERQRAIIAHETTPQGWSGGRGIVAEGRDITTVVAPDATVRILLVAGEEARLARRAAELFGAADEAAIEATRDQVVRRDADDATVSEFHVAADGVVTLDSSTLTLPETLEAAIRIVEQGRA
ncbi:(d)CMP kinase [Salana multivorans]